MAFARQPTDFRPPTTCIFAGQHTDSRVGTPKMPGEPMRVQPSRARRPAGEDGWADRGQPTSSAIAA
jgi:hypothetical protein